MKTLVELLTAAVDGEFDVPEHTRAVVADLVIVVQEWLGQQEIVDVLDSRQHSSAILREQLQRMAGHGLDSSRPRFEVEEFANTLRVTDTRTGSMYEVAKDA